MRHVYRNQKYILVLSTFVTLGLTAACKPETLAKTKTKTGTDTDTSVSVSLDAASFAASPDRAYGWTNSASAALSFAITPSTVAGAKYECRSGPKSLFTGGTPPAWTWCDGASGASTVHYPEVDVSNPSGTYRSEVRYTLGGSTGTSATLDYYVHTSLNGVASCSAEGTDTAADAAARAQLGSITGTFGSTTSLSNPFVTVQFDSSSRKYISYGYDQSSTANAEILSLRRKFTLSSDRKLMFVRRVYTARLGLAASTCDNKWPTHCSVFAVAADGRGVCLGWTAGAYVVNSTTKWAYSQIDEMQSPDGGSYVVSQGRKSSRKTRNPASATGDVLYIAD